MPPKHRNGPCNSEWGGTLDGSSRRGSGCCGCGKCQAGLPALNPILRVTAPTMEGQLWRRGRLTSRWKSRADHADVRGSVLVIYKCGSRGGLKALLREGGHVAVHELAGAGEARPLDAATRKGFYPFSVPLAEGGRTLHLAADSHAARQQWLEALNGARTVLSASDLKLLSTIGEGHFGKVLLAQRKGCSGQEGLLAVKEIKLTAGMPLAGALTERLLLATLPQHPFVITLQTAFRTGNYLSLGFDFMPGADLFEHIRRLDIRVSLSSARFYASQILLALQHLHAHNIVYRDLKPENVLVDAQGNLCLADVGLSKRLLPGGARTFTVCGTRAYLAPEMIRPDRVGYGFSVDFWQLGCFLYELYAGRSPFWSAPPRTGGARAAATAADATAARILGGEFTRPPRIEDSAWQLVQALLAPRPEARLGCGSAPASPSRPPAAAVTAPGTPHSPSSAEQEPTSPGEGDSPPGGWAAVRAHSFFDGVQWDAVMARAVPAPFAPAPSHANSVVNFSTQFTERRPRWGGEEDALAHRGAPPAEPLLFVEELRGFAFSRGGGSGAGDDAGAESPCEGGSASLHGHSCGCAMSAEPARPAAATAVAQ